MTKSEALNNALKHAEQAETSNIAYNKGTWGHDVKPSILSDVMREAALANMWANIAGVLQ